MKTALVTGATGFIGGQLARRLIADGWRVTALMRPGSKKPDCPGLKTHVHDGTTEDLVRLLRRLRPDVVFHLASLFLAEHTPADVRPLVESNVLFGCQLAEAMAQSRTLRLVNTGTSWQHYRDGAYDPVNLYAATKQAFADILAYYEGAHELRAITLELFDTYGPADPRRKLLATLRRAVAGDAAFSPGRQRIDLVHVSDVVEAFVMAARRLLAGRVRRSETYAVASGRPRPLREVAAVFARANGLRLRAKWGARPYRPREMMRPWSQGRRLPGWRPKIGLEEGFRGLSQLKPVRKP